MGGRKLVIGENEAKPSIEGNENKNNDDTDEETNNFDENLMNIGFNQQNWEKVNRKQNKPQKLQKQ